MFRVRFHLHDVLAALLMMAAGAWGWIGDSGGEGGGVVSVNWEGWLGLGGFGSVRTLEKPCSFMSMNGGYSWLDPGKLSKEGW